MLICIESYCYINMWPDAESTDLNELHGLIGLEVNKKSIETDIRSVYNLYGKNHTNINTRSDLDALTKKNLTRNK